MPKPASHAETKKEGYFDLLQYAKGALTPGEQLYKENIALAPFHESIKLTWNTRRIEEWRKWEREYIPKPINITTTPGLSLEVANTIKVQQGNPAILNFANNLAPGQPGARLTGNTQEEQLLKQTSLGATLKSHQYPIDDYKEPITKEYHYDDHGLIYSPCVRVLYDDTNGKPLNHPWDTSIITSAAIICPKKTGGLHFASSSDFQVTFQKAMLMASIAVEKGHDSIVVGLWGLGAFDNPPEDMASIWRKVASLFPSLKFIFPTGSSGRRHTFFDYLCKP